MSYEKYKESIVLTNKARREAVKVLIANHREEFDGIYVEIAKNHGLNPTKTISQQERSV